MIFMLMQQEQRHRIQQMISIRDTYKSLVHSGSVSGKPVIIFSLQSTYASRQSHSFGQSIIGSGYVGSTDMVDDTNNSKKHATDNMAGAISVSVNNTNTIKRSATRSVLLLHDERAETTISERRFRS